MPFVSINYLSAPFFHFSDTWQLVINTGTTIVTFLVVFLIQTRRTVTPKPSISSWMNLIRSHVPAHNDMIDIEKLSDEELEDLKERYAALCAEHTARTMKNKTATSKQ